MSSDFVLFLADTCPRNV